MSWGLEGQHLFLRVYKIIENENENIPIKNPKENVGINFPETL
jgi:hypothetical protein